MEKSLVTSIAKLLTLIGSLNWGLIGLGHFTGGNMNIVSIVLGGAPALEAVVYLLVGLSAIYLLVQGKR